MIKWTEASHSVIATAQELVDDHHDELVDARLGFVFRSEPSIVAGRSVAAGVQLVPARLQVMLEYDFLIWVSQLDWETAPEIIRKHMLDHVLYHCGFDSSSEKYYIRRHDVEEFIPMIQRYGLEDPNLQNAVRVALQLPLMESAPRGRVDSLTGAQLDQVAREVSEHTGFKVEVRHFAGE